MNILPVILQLLSGAVGGNLMGSAFKDLSLGPIGNSLAGLLGGGICGHLLQSVTGMDGTGGTSDSQIFLTNLAGGALGGALMTAVLGLLGGMFRKRH